MRRCQSQAASRQSVYVICASILVVLWCTALPQAAYAQACEASASQVRCVLAKAVTNAASSSTFCFTLSDVPTVLATSKCGASSLDLQALELEINSACLSPATAWTFTYQMPGGAAAASAPADAVLDRRLLTGALILKLSFPAGTKTANGAQVCMTAASGTTCPSLKTLCKAPAGSTSGSCAATLLVANGANKCCPLTVTTPATTPKASPPPAAAKLSPPPPKAKSPPPSATKAPSPSKSPTPSPASVTNAPLDSGTCEFCLHMSPKTTTPPAVLTVIDPSRQLLDNFKEILNLIDPDASIMERTGNGAVESTRNFTKVCVTATEAVMSKLVTLLKGGNLTPEELAAGVNYPFTSIRGSVAEQVFSADPMCAGLLMYGSVNSRCGEVLQASGLPDPVYDDPYYAVPQPLSYLTQDPSIVAKQFRQPRMSCALLFNYRPSGFPYGYPKKCSLDDSMPFKLTSFTPRLNTKYMAGATQKTEDRLCWQITEDKEAVVGEGCLADKFGAFRYLQFALNYKLAQPKVVIGALLRRNDGPYKPVVAEWYNSVVDKVKVPRNGFRVSFINNNELGMTPAVVRANRVEVCLRLVKGAGKQIADMVAIPGDGLWYSLSNWDNTCCSSAVMPVETLTTTTSG